MTNDDMAWRRGLYSGATKGHFYTHISIFSILNSAYTHFQGFIFKRRRRRLAFRSWSYSGSTKGCFYTHISTFSMHMLTFRVLFSCNDGEDSLSESWFYSGTTKGCFYTHIHFTYLMQYPFRYDAITNSRGLTLVASTSASRKRKVSGPDTGSLRYALAYR